MNQMASKKRTRNAKNEKEGETAETLTFVRIDFLVHRPTQRAGDLTLKKTYSPADLALAHGQLLQLAGDIRSPLWDLIDRQLAKE